MGSEEHIGDPDFGDEDGDEPVEPIDESERQALHQDLLDVKTLKNVLGLRGVKGVVVYCPDCEGDHFLGWDLLAGNLQEILQSGRTPVHEPAWQPDPDEYVGWDYARGFLDGYETYPEERAHGEACGFCGEKLPEGGYVWTFCPTCGKELAPVNLIFHLRGRGWTDNDISQLLQQSGFDPPLYTENALEGDSPKEEDV